MTFSFDTPGVLTELDFDGVKDEPYEYFLLQTAGDPDRYFFDSFENSTADSGLIDVSGEVIFLQEGGPVDDKSLSLGIPYAAGQKFMLTYGQLDHLVPQNDPIGNGARLQGITVIRVPEPATCILGLALIAALAFALRNYKVEPVV